MQRLGVLGRLREMARLLVLVLLRLVVLLVPEEIVLEETVPEEKGLDLGLEHLDPVAVVDPVAQSDLVLEYQHLAVDLDLEHLDPVVRSGLVLEYRHLVVDLVLVAAVGLVRVALGLEVAADLAVVAGLGRCLPSEQ